MAKRCRPQWSSGMRSPVISAQQDQHLMRDCASAKVDEPPPSHSSLRLVGAELVDHLVVRQHHRQRCAPPTACRASRQMAASRRTRSAAPLTSTHRERADERQRDREPDRACRRAIVMPTTMPRAPAPTPTDRSIPPVTMTAVIPIAMIADESEVARDVEQVLLRGEGVGERASTPGRRRTAASETQKVCRLVSQSSQCP